MGKVSYNVRHYLWTPHVHHHFPSKFQTVACFMLWAREQPGSLHVLGKERLAKDRKTLESDVRQWLASAREKWGIEDAASAREEVLDRIGLAMVRFAAEED